MKRSELFFTALLLPLDLVAVVLAFLGAYQLRLSQGEAQFIWPFNQYLIFVASLAPFWLIVFALAGLYSLKRQRRIWEELGSIFVGVSGGTFLVIAWPFLTRQEFFSRLVVIYIFAFAFLAVTVGRLAVRLLRQWLYLRGTGVSRVLLIGNSSLTAPLERALTAQAGYRVVGRLASLRALADVDPDSIDILLQTDPSFPEDQVMKLIEYADKHHLEFQFVPNLFHARTTSVESISLAGMPLFRLKRTRLEAWGRIVKRTIDLMIASLALIVSLPIMLIVAILILLDSPGPILFSQMRVGAGGKLFRIYKFRSMNSDFAVEKSRARELADYRKLNPEKAADSARHLFFQKVEDDPRITRIGRILRKTNLDELPQLYNVIRGDMSLVGPRPLREEEFAQVSAHERSYYWVYHVKPGLTGLWQVSGRSELSDEERIRLDLDYVENWSIFRDLLIIAKTALQMLTPQRGAR